MGAKDGARHSERMQNPRCPQILLPAFLSLPFSHYSSHFPAFFSVHICAQFFCGCCCAISSALFTFYNYFWFLPRIVPLAIYGNFFSPATSSISDPRKAPASLAFSIVFCCIFHIICRLCLAYYISQLKQCGGHKTNGARNRCSEKMRRTYPPLREPLESCALRTRYCRTFDNMSYLWSIAIQIFDHTCCFECNISQTSKSSIKFACYITYVIDTNMRHYIILFM